MQKTFKLKVTTTRRQSLTATPALTRAFCAVCRGEVPTLTCREAAGFLEIGEEDLGDLIAAGKAHAFRTVSGGLRVCQNSLIRGENDARFE